MSTVKAWRNQSNYDLCLKILGSVDGIVNLCKSNNITSINTPIEIYETNDNDIIERVNTGYDYATKSSLGLKAFMTEYSNKNQIFFFVLEDDTQTVFLTEN